MEYIPGQTLKQAWPVLTAEERTTILDELRGYIAQLRALSPPTEAGSEVKIGRLDGEGILLPSIIPCSGGPFSSSVEELHHWLVRPPRRQDRQSMYWHQITQHLGSTDYPIVFTHCDLAARNIMVRDGHIVAILDWEYSGWCPAYWEYVFAITGMDNVDWATLETDIPSLFTQRYDFEYILLSFIITAS